LPKEIEADERRLRQVLMHLLSNAIKFTERGKVIFSVKARQIEDKLQPERYFYNIRFQIEDSGIGISQERLINIFSSFQQEGMNKQNSEGSGLGLAISQKIVTCMGSKIQVQSEIEVGSTFYFEVKLPTTTCKITSQFEPESQTNIVIHNLEIVAPRAEDINILLILSRKGLIQNLLAELRRIEQSDETLIPFTQKLSKLAKSFKLRELRQTIEQYL
jgi:hypothetical protein